MKNWTPPSFTPLAQAKTVPAQYSVFDIETINWTQPYAVGYYDGKDYTLYEGKQCISTFCDAYLVKNNRGRICYAHNAGKFDFAFIIDELVKRKQYELCPLRIGSRIVEIKIKSNKHLWILRDSITILNASLERLTKNFGVEHEKGVLDHQSINWQNWQELKEQWEPYLEKDCKGLHEVLGKFEKEMNTLFNTSIRHGETIARLAMHTYRKNYLDQSIPTYRSQEADIRKAYYGGRVEIFKTHATNLHYYDVNSLYPYVMKKYASPVGRPIKSYIMTIEDCGVAYCTITTPKDIRIPVLPHRINGKLMFPRGTWKGWYCTPELRLAAEKGYTVHVHYGYKFQESHLFSKYIDDLYKLKQSEKKDTPKYMIAKLLMNSLYGKFGQKREKKKLTINPPTITNMQPVFEQGKYGLYEETVESNSAHILPAIAAFITSYARIELYRLLEQSEPIYCDTDSVLTQTPLHVGEQLGELKDEYPQGIQEAIFLLPKMYAIKMDGKEMTRAKGFPNGTFNYAQMREAVLSQAQLPTYRKTVFATPFESMRRNKQWVGMIDVQRTVRTMYDKRKIVGVETEPHEVDECSAH